MSTPRLHATIVRWRFFDYVESGDNKIEKWLLGNPVLKARLTQTLIHLGGLRWDQWTRIYSFKKLEQKRYVAAGLAELRFQCDGAEQRPVGSLGVSVDTFIVLMGCCKKGSLYYPSPPHPFDVALSRKARYLADPTSVEERRLT